MIFASRSDCPRLARGFFLWLLLAMPAAAAQAAPYRPADDAVVLERLPAALSSLRPSRDRELTADQAAQLARVFIERSRRSGDPRELGYAQGVLAPWWSLADAPNPVLLLRATLRQARHDFDGALDDLQRLLARQPEDAQARLTQATVLRVLGRYPEALAACEQLQGRADAFVAELCATAIRGLMGEREAAIARLDALRPQLGAQLAGVAAWYYAERADLAERAGDDAGAEAWYREALAAHAGDLGLRASYADLLLDAGRAAEVLPLIAADEQVEALLLRRALALRALGDPAFTALDRRIRDNFAAARLRGEALHLREEARYSLAVGEIERGLELARANWAVQHEPWDARLLLLAAKLSGHSEAAEPVRRWLAETRLQDARLAGVLP